MSIPDLRLTQPHADSHSVLDSPSNGDREAGATLVPLILAGGSGTRFWPRSRRGRAKQVLSLNGDRSLIQQTIDRLASLASCSQVWVSTTAALAPTIRAQVSNLNEPQILQEPIARNTAAACGLLAFILERQQPNAILGVFPSDHVVKDDVRFTATVTAGITVAKAGDHIVVLGVPATRPETGYGYIEQGQAALTFLSLSLPVRHVDSFIEKPDLTTAEELITYGRFAWNSGMFIVSARTLCAAFREHQPSMAAHLETIAQFYGSDLFQDVYEDLYKQCDDISLDYAVIEPRSRRHHVGSNIYCIPAEFGWNDLGSWHSLHEHLSANDEQCCDDKRNVMEGLHAIAERSFGNYVYAPHLQISLLGVSDLVVVQTGDALLVTSRDNAQDVSTIVKTLVNRGLTQYL